MFSKHPLCAALTLALAAMTVAPVLNAQTSGTRPADEPQDEAVALDTMVVRAQYESQVRAIDIKRDSDAIQDTISSDAIGQFPDKNVGESLSRLPGISVTRDQGEGRFVVIRGLDAGLNSVSVDGIAVGTPEDSLRAAPLDVIPSDSTERLTVVKAPTPDMPGDSIGGAILIESGSAFDRDGRSVRGKFEFSHQPLSGETSPKAAFNYSDLFAEGDFGVAVGLSYQDRDYESDNIEIEYDADEDITDGLYAIEVQQRKYFINRERTGLNLNLDWRGDDDSRYFVRSLFTDFTDAESRQNSIIPVGEGDFTPLEAGVFRVDGIDPGDFSRRLRFRTKEEETFTLSAGGENRFDARAIDYRLGYTQMRERVPDEVEARFEYEGDEDVSLILDQTRPIPRYSISDTPLGGWLRNENYEFNRFVVAPIRVDDEEFSAAFNFSFDADSVIWKAGVLGRWRERGVDIDETELRRGPDLNLGSWTSPSPDYRQGDMGDGISPDALRAYVRQRLGEYSARPQDEAANTEISLIEDYAADEDILAGYLMATAEFDALRLIAGVRVEHTDFNAIGNVVDLLDEDTIGSIGVREVSTDYTEVLPGVHLRYDTQDDWVLRGAYTHTIARPSFGDISPRTRINRDDEEVELGNPELDPYRSRNFDLSFERYFGESGIFAAGVFHKDIEGYIAETTERELAEFDGFDVSQPINGDDASVLGLELNLQQHFGSGVLVGASATWLDTEFRLLPGSDRSGETLPLPLSSERLYSAFLGYERGGLSARLAAVYRSEYLDEIDVDDAGFDIWVASNTQLDFTLDYKINSLWGVYFEASNLLDEPLELFQGSSDRTLQNELYGRTYAVGARLRF